MYALPSFLRYAHTIYIDHLCNIEMICVDSETNWRWFSFDLDLGLEPNFTVAVLLTLFSRLPLGAAILLGVGR